MLATMADLCMRYSVSSDALEAVLNLCYVSCEFIKIPLSCECIWDIPCVAARSNITAATRRRATCMDYPHYGHDDCLMNLISNFMSRPRPEVDWKTICTTIVSIETWTFLEIIYSVFQHAAPVSDLEQIQLEDHVHNW